MPVILTKDEAKVLTAGGRQKLSEEEKWNRKEERWFRNRYGQRRVIKTPKRSHIQSKHMAQRDMVNPRESSLHIHLYM